MFLGAAVEDGGIVEEMAVETPNPLLAKGGAFDHDTKEEFEVWENL